MRKREREVIAKKLEAAPDEKPGRPICIRLFESDEIKLDELVKETGNETSGLVRRMVRFALSDRYQEFAANPCRDRLDLLIEQSRRGDGDSERLSEILERIERLEDAHKIAAANASAFQREIYSLAGLSVLVLNTILTRLFELALPTESDKEKIALMADGVIRQAAAQTILDLDRCCSFHGIESGPDLIDELHFASRLKEPAFTPSAK